MTCQMGVWAAENGRSGQASSALLVLAQLPDGPVFVGGQLYEYIELATRARPCRSSAYGSVFYLTTGFHGLHVTGGLIAFLFLLGRTYAAKRFTHEQATSAIVVSYYWHFVDVVWIGLFATIYLIR